MEPCPRYLEHVPGGQLPPLHEWVCVHEHVTDIGCEEQETWNQGPWCMSKAVSTLAGSFRKLPKRAVLQPPRPYKGPGCAHLTVVQQGEGADAQRVLGEPGRHRRAQDVSDNEIKITSHIDGQVVVTIHTQAPPPGRSWNNSSRFLIFLHTWYTF